LNHGCQTDYLCATTQRQDETALLKPSLKNWRPSSLESFRQVRLTQGDQIFAHWVTVYLGKFYYNSSPNFCAIFSRGYGYALILAKKWVGSLLGDFFHKLTWSPWSGCCKVLKIFSTESNCTHVCTYVHGLLCFLSIGQVMTSLNGAALQAHL
jgi:hypothetical protein